jgi:hypothetical protein
MRGGAISLQIRCDRVLAPHTRFRLEPHLLLCEGNSEALVGRPALWRGEIPDCVHQNHIIRVRVDRERLRPDFLVHYMNTPAARRYFLSRAQRPSRASRRRR